MIGKGMARRFRRYAPRDAELARLESETKAARIGLWSQPNPVPPWEWRRGEGVPQTVGVVGNWRSHVYQKPARRGAAASAAQNRVTFPSEAEAEKAEYRRSKDCW
jgi:hypothetical protein